MVDVTYKSDVYLWLAGELTLLGHLVSQLLSLRTVSLVISVSAAVAGEDVGECLIPTLDNLEVDLACV